MSEREEHDFVKEYMTWMKGPLAKYESLHIFNFGYERPLPFPSIALTPDSTVRFNLQISGMQTPSRSSIVIIGEKYVGRFGEIMSIVGRILEDTQALPFTIFLQTEYQIKLENTNSHMHETPALVGTTLSISCANNLIHSGSYSTKKFRNENEMSGHLQHNS